MIKKLLLPLLLLFSLVVQGQVPPPGVIAASRKVSVSTAFDVQIAYEAVGTAATGTTSCTPAYPTVSAEDGLIMAVGTKIRESLISTPSGWHRLGGSEMDAVMGSGGDQGEIKQTLFWKEATGSESGTVTVSCSNCNSMNAVIYAFGKDADAYWGVTVSGGGFQVPDVAYSVESHQELTSAVNDLLFVVSSTNADLYSYSAQAVSQAGITFSTVNAEIGEYPAATGNQQEQFASVFTVTAGAGTDKMIYTATVSGEAANSPVGTTHFVQLRQHHLAQELPPSGLKIWRASEAVDVTWSGDGSALWDGQRTSTEVVGTVATRYSIATFNGRPCFKFHAELVNSTNYTRRVESSQLLPWQPGWVLGSQVIHEIRVETPADAPDIWNNFDIVQNHTGTAEGGPYPDNFPIMYIAWAYAGQTGWTAGGTATGGELMLVNKAGGERIKFPSVVWAPSTTYQIRYHIKWDIASGDPALKLWCSVDEGGFTLLYENYVRKTIWEDADIPTNGSVANVGGSLKVGVYNSEVNNGTDAANSISAGNSGYTIYMPAAKVILQHPTDDDYITDVTDNDNPLYDWVDTTND